MSSGAPSDRGQPVPEEGDAERRLDRGRSVLALAGGIAHELGNLLASNLMILDLLAAGTPDESGRRALVELEASTRQAIDAVRQLLRLARAADGEPIVFQLQYLFADLRKLAAFVFPRTPLALDYPPDLWPLAGDPLEIYQILLGLVARARAATEPSRSANEAAGEVKLAARNLPADERDAAGLASGSWIAIEVTTVGARSAPDLLGVPSAHALAARYGGRAEPLPGGGARVVLPAFVEPETTDLPALLARLRREAGGRRPRARAQASGSGSKICSMATPKRRARPKASGRLGS